MKIEFKAAELKTKEKQFFKSVIGKKLSQELVERFGEVEDRSFSFKVNWKKSYNAHLWNKSYEVHDVNDVFKRGLNYNPVCGSPMVDPPCGSQWEFFTVSDLFNLVYGNTITIYNAHGNTKELAKIKRVIFNDKDISLMRQAIIPKKIADRYQANWEAKQLERLTKKRFFDSAIPYLKGESNTINSWDWKMVYEDHKAILLEEANWTIFDVTVSMKLEDKFGRTYYDNIHIRVPLQGQPLLREYKINQLI